MSRHNSGHHCAPQHLLRAISLLIFAAGTRTGGLVLLPATDLRCEHMATPMGVDVYTPLLSWTLGAAPGQHGVIQGAFHVRLARDANFSDVIWDFHEQSNATSVRSPLLAPDTKYFWTIAWTGCSADTQFSREPSNSSQACDDAPTATSFFVTGLTAELWADAEWLSCATVGACDYIRSPVVFLPAQPLRATLHLATGGWVEAWVNGNKAGDNAVLEGSWTQWNARMPCTAYDVTALLQAGNNSVGLVLGNGWWGHLSHRAMAAAVLSVELLSGQRVLVSTTAGIWRGSAGPITGDDIYNGETYDLRAELPGWSTPSFSIAHWDMTAPVADPLVANASRSWQAVQPVIARRGSAVIPAISITAFPQVGQFVVDFGVNSAGWTRLMLPPHCPAGTAIRLRHAENLFANGTVNQGNLRSALATDVLTCDGRAEVVVYEPRFTYHGFRYVGIEGWDVQALLAPTLAAFTKIEVHNSVEYAEGTGAIPSFINFSSPHASSPNVLSEIQDMIRRGQLSNLYGGVATDCPQRNERQGWMADASVSAESAIFNFDMHAFYASWLRTIVDAQKTTAFHDCDPSSPIYPDCDGADTDTSPHVTGLYGNRPADPSWGAALDIVYDLLLRYYADYGVAEKYYPAVMAYASWLLRVADAQGGLVTFHYYGDWLQPNKVASSDYVSMQTSAFNFLRTLRVAINAAAALGQAGDAELLTAAYSNAAAIYNARYLNVSGTGCYGDGSQAEQVYPLYLSIQPGGDSTLQAFVTACLLPAIAANNTHVDTGIISTKYLMPLLSRAGFSDVALALALQEDFPSWGAMKRVFNQTTITEHWNPVANPSGDAMSSRNHPAFSSVGSWLYQAVLGLRLGDAASADFSIPGLPPGSGVTWKSGPASLRIAGYGWTRVVIAPEIVTNAALPGAAGGVWTVAGWVGASWAYDSVARRLALNTSLPVGVAGDVRTPHGLSWTPSSITIMADGAAVWQAGVYLPGVPGVVAGAICGRSKDRVCLTVVSGDYQFVILSSPSSVA